MTATAPPTADATETNETETSATETTAADVAVEVAPATDFVVPSFTIGPVFTDEQRAFLDTHGFIKFGGFATAQEVKELRHEIELLEARWIQEDEAKLFGVPITWGRDESGRRFINRLPFTSVHSERIHSFVTDERFEWIRQICGPEYRLGEREKDGVVANNYRNCEGSSYRQLGWHVDGLRDFFYGRVPQRYLNVGFSLTDSPRSLGGLRVIPGTHKQGMLGFLFGKAHFLDNREDPREVCVETKAGDLTLHDGRLWHRVARCPLTGEASRRMNMYMPFLKDAVQLKDESSRTPFYHRLQRFIG